MKLGELFLQQLDREVTSTRRLLERVPDGKPDWKPHDKSMPLGYLAALVATMPSWITMIIDRDFLDLATGDRPRTRSSSRELVTLFDDSVSGAKRSLLKVTDDHLMTPWQLRLGSKVVDEKSRYATIGDTFSHFAHHRGQLTVYLRLNDVAVPSIYGPTADEQWGG